MASAVSAISDEKKKAIDSYIKEFERYKKATDKENFKVNMDVNISARKNLLRYVKNEYPDLMDSFSMFQGMPKKTIRELLKDNFLVEDSGKFYLTREGATYDEVPTLEKDKVLKIERFDPNILQIGEIKKIPESEIEKIIKEGPKDIKRIKGGMEEEEITPEQKTEMEEELESNKYFLGLAEKYGQRIEIVDVKPLKTLLPKNKASIIKQNIMTDMKKRDALMPSDIKENRFKTRPHTFSKIKIGI